MSLRSLGPQPSASTRFRHSDSNLVKYTGAPRPARLRTQRRGAEAEAGHVEAAQHVHVEALDPGGGCVVVAEEAHRSDGQVGQHLLLDLLLEAQAGHEVPIRALEIG